MEKKLFSLLHTLKFGPFAQYLLEVIRSEKTHGTVTGIKRKDPR